MQHVHVTNCKPIVGILRLGAGTGGKLLNPDEALRCGT
jgi:hypothetical protein